MAGDLVRNFNFSSVGNSKGIIEAQITKADTGAGPVDLKMRQSSSTSFFGRVVSFLFKGAENREVKQQFVLQMRRDYGIDLTKDGRVDLTSRKPLSASVVVAIRAEARKERTEKLHEAPTPSRTSATSAAGTPRKVETPASRGLALLTKQGNVFADIASLTNDFGTDRLNKGHVDVFNQSHSFQERTLADALMNATGFIQPNINQLAELVAEKHPSTPNKTLHVLKDAYINAGLSSRDAEQAATGAHIMGVQANPRFALHMPAMSKQVAAIESAMRSNDLDAAGKGTTKLQGLATEYRAVLANQTKFFQAFGTVLTDPAVLAKLPSEQQAMFKELGEHYQALSVEWTRPGGPIQNLDAFCADVLANPDAALQSLKPEPTDLSAKTTEPKPPVTTEIAVQGETVETGTLEPEKKPVVEDDAGTVKTASTAPKTGALKPDPLSEKEQEVDEDGFTAEERAEADKLLQNMDTRMKAVLERQTKLFQERRAQNETVKAEADKAKAIDQDGFTAAERAEADKLLENLTPRMKAVMDRQNELFQARRARSEPTT